MKWFLEPPKTSGHFVVYSQRNGMRLVTLYPDDIAKQCFWIERFYVHFSTAQMWCRLPELGDSMLEEVPK